MKRLASLAFIFAIAISCNNITAEQGPATKRKGKLYLRTYMWTGMYGTSLDISWLYFGDDGTLIRNPVAGVDPVDLPREQKENSKNTGTWKIQGDKITVQWLNGKSDSWSFDKKDGSFSTIDGGITTEQEPLPAGYTLEGKFSALSVLPNVSNSNTLVFSRDGKFALNKTGTVTTPDVTGISSSDQAGTYQISGNTLTMTFDNGDVKKSVVTVWEMDGKENIVINTRYFPKED